MDFTLLILIIVFIITIQQGMWEVAGGVFYVILFATKNRYLIIASFGVAIVAYFVFGYHYPSWLIIAALSVFFIALAKRDNERPSGPESYYPQSPIG